MGTEFNLGIVEVVATTIAILIAVTAAAFTGIGLSGDLANNLATEVGVLVNQTHTAPTFVVCPVLGTMGVIQTPTVAQCVFKPTFSLSADNYELGNLVYGNQGNVSCTDELPQLFQSHPLRPLCIVLSNDAAGLLIPRRGGQTMTLLLTNNSGVTTVVMYNTTALALASDPLQFQRAQAFTISANVYSVVMAKEASFTPLDGPTEARISTSTVSQIPTNPDSSGFAFVWFNDEITFSRQFRPVSTEVLLGIALGIVSEVVIGIVMFVVLTCRFRIEHLKALEGDETNVQL